MINHSSMHKTTKKQGKSPAKMHISLRVRTPAKVRKTLWYIIEKPKLNLTVQFWFNLAGMDGFEPSKCQSQSLVPYRLATSQYCVSIVSHFILLVKRFMKKIIFYEKIDFTVWILRIFLNFILRYYILNIY